MTTKTPEQLQKARDYQKQYRASEKGQSYYHAYRRDPEVKQAKAEYKRKAKNDPVTKIEYQRYSLKSALKTRYGLTVEDYDKMLIAQCGCCACCSAQMILPNEPSVDHHHTTGEVRSLLCNNCNLGIGHFDESVARLELAIQYLRSFV